MTQHTYNTDITKINPQHTGVIHTHTHTHTHTVEGGSFHVSLAPENDSVDVTVVVVMLVSSDGDAGVCA